MISTKPSGYVVRSCQGREREEMIVALACEGNNLG